MTDLARIKRNVAKMASMDAPIDDIDGYIASEGVTVDDVRNFQAPSAASGQFSQEAGAITQSFDQPRAETSPYAVDDAKARYLQQMEGFKGGRSEALTQASQAGVLGGYDDEIAAGMLAPIDAGIDMLKGEGFDMSRAYERKQKMLDLQKRQRREAYPGSSIVGEVAGGLALGGTVRAAPAVGTTLPSAGAVPTLAGRVPGIVTAPAEGALYGALYGSGEARPGERLRGAAEGAATGAVLGTALHGIGAGVSRVFAKKPMPSRLPRLVVARRMPDGSVRYGKPGQIHADLVDLKAEGRISPVAQEDMGFAFPDGPFLSRDEALKALPIDTAGQVKAKNPYGMQAEHLNEIGASGVAVAPYSVDRAAEAQAMYRASEAEGVVFNAQPIERLKTNLKVLAGDPNKRLRPKTLGTVKDLDKQLNGPMTLEKFDELRQGIKADLKKAEGTDQLRLMKMKEYLDNFADNIKPGDMTGGQKGVEYLNKARTLWAQAKKSETIERIMDMADVDGAGKYTQSGFANAVRREMRTLYKSIQKGKAQGWSKEEVALIRQMARGGSNSRLVNLMAKFDPNGVVSILGGQLVGSAVPGIGNVALPLGGYVAGRAADKAAMAAAERIRSGAAGGAVPQLPRLPNMGLPFIRGATAPTTEERQAIRSLIPGR